jgi:hypothetical protein
LVAIAAVLMDAGDPQGITETQEQYEGRIREEYFKNLYIYSILQC